MKILRVLILAIVKVIGYIFHFFISEKVNYFLLIIKAEFMTCLYKRRFKKFGKNSIIFSLAEVKSLDRISVGDNTRIGTQTLLRCFDADGEENQSTITIGDGVNIGDLTSITSAKQIVIGNGVRTGRMVLITDNSHGHTNLPDELEISPILRPIVSKGPVVIEDNVWVGEKVSIMPNVRIGRGAIIAANAVVTKDIPEYAIAAGCPAKVLKIIK